MPAPNTVAIRSYRGCFQLERRLHRIDRWRIPVPYGIPLRGIAYAVAALAGLLALSDLPLLGPLLGAFHPALRLVVLPIALAYALCRVRLDGRPAHAAVIAWLRYRCTPARRAGCRRAESVGRVRLADVHFAPDELGARYRPALIRGPTELLLRYPAVARQRRRTLEFHQHDARPMWHGKRIRVDARQAVRVR